MRIVIQRVNQAQVTIDNEIVGKIDRGLCLFVGLKVGDNEQTVIKAANKITKMRIFEDLDGKTNLSIKEVNGEILSVSQFTLLANTQKGNRPSFIDAMRPPESDQLWKRFDQQLIANGLNVETGHFGADMKVNIENDGPFTIVLDI